MIEFQRTEEYYSNEEADYSLNKLVRIPTCPLNHLVEYRVKLLTTKQTFSIAGGVSKTIPTCAIVTKGFSKFSAHIKQNEKIPLNCENEGYISTGFRGRLYITFTNYSINTVQLSGGICIAYLIFSPFAN